MRYFRLELVTNLDGTVTKGVYEYGKKEDAMAAWHSGLGGYLKKRSEYAGVLEVVMRGDGYVEASQAYDFTIDELTDGGENDG